MCGFSVNRGFFNNIYMDACVTKAESRARGCIVVSVILSVVDAFPTAPRLSALPVLSIISVAESVLLGWPTRVAKCYQAVLSRASFKSDKVVQSAKFDCGSRRGYLTWYFTSAFPKADWAKQSAKSVCKQKKSIFDPFRIVETPDLSDTLSK